MRIYTRAVRMHINGRIAMALAVSERTQAHQKETMSGPITHQQRLQVSALVAKDFFKLRDSLYRLGAKGFFSGMPYALMEITEGILPFISALRILKRSDLADAYVNALFDFLPFCVGVVRRFDGGSDIADILNRLGILFVALADPSDKSSIPEHLKRFEQALEGQPVFDCLDEVQNALRKFVEGVPDNSADNAKHSMDDLRAYYVQQASALGVDLNDPDDQIAQIVRIGLKDLDPTRVLKDCQHIHVMITSCGMPAEMLGLPTAGSKQIVCLKHGHSIEALSLDDAYEGFAKVSLWSEDQICCENCPNKAPHPIGWEWSNEWNAQQHAKYQEFVTRNDTNCEHDH